MNQNQVKLIAIDMDGTLLNSQKEIPEENIKAIQEAAAAGIKIVLCTGDVYKRQSYGCSANGLCALEPCDEC